MTDLNKEFLDSQLKQAVTFSEAIKHFDDDFVGEDIDEIPSDEEKREKEERADLKARRKAFFDEIFHSGEEKKKKVIRKLPPNLKEKMGEANLLFATREFDKAIPLLLEVIKEAPHFPDAFHTLGMIYEENNDKKNALEIYMIAAHLTPRDINLWLRLARLGMSLNLVSETTLCYINACKWLEIKQRNSLAKKTDFEYTPQQVTAIFKERAINLYKLYTDGVGGNPREIEGFFDEYLQKAPQDAQAAIERTKILVSLNDTSAALCCLRRLLSTMTSKTVNYDALNIFIELCIDEKCFREGITMSLKLSGENPPFHIVANTIAALIHCGDLVDAEVRLQVLLKETENVDDYLYIVADAYQSEQQYASALSLYQRLKGEYDSPGIWLRKADCLNALNKVDEAIAEYEKALKENGGLEWKETVCCVNSLGILLHRKGRYAECVKHMKPIIDYSIEEMLIWKNNHGAKTKRPNLCPRKKKVKKEEEKVDPDSIFIKKRRKFSAKQRQQTNEITQEDAVASLSLLSSGKSDGMFSFGTLHEHQISDQQDGVKENESINGHISEESQSTIRQEKDDLQIRQDNNFDENNANSHQGHLAADMNVENNIKTHMDVEIGNSSKMITPTSSTSSSKIISNNPMNIDNTSDNQSNVKCSQTKHSQRQRQNPVDAILKGYTPETISIEGNHPLSLEEALQASTLSRTNDHNFTETNTPRLDDYSIPAAESIDETAFPKTGSEQTPEMKKRKRKSKQDDEDYVFEENSDNDDDDDDFSDTEYASKNSKSAERSHLQIKVFDAPKLKRKIHDSELDGASNNGNDNGEDYDAEREREDEEDKDEDENEDEELGEKRPANTAEAAIGVDAYFSMLLRFCDSCRRIGGSAAPQLAGLLQCSAFLHQRRACVNALLAGFCAEKSNFVTAFSALRRLYYTDVDKTETLQFLSRIISKSDLILSNLLVRSMLRMSLKARSDEFSALHGTTLVFTSQVKSALSNLLPLLKRHNDVDALVFYIAVCYLKSAVNRKVQDSDKAVLHSMAFFDYYLKLTKRSAASLFNVGRAYQQLALNNYAVRYYREALLDETAPLQLKRKIAFNISIIFKDAHNDGLVRGLYEQYLTF